MLYLLKHHKHPNVALPLGDFINILFLIMTLKSFN